jgi:NADPH:quinone reductase-like Zn-dependent oxidoreductase
MAPNTGKALVTRVDGDKSVMDLKDVPIPKIEPHQVLVRVSSVAQNPTDGKCNPTQHAAIPAHRFQFKA